MALATAQRLEVDEWTVRCRICSSGNDDEHHIQYHAQRINFLPEIEKRLDINHTIYPGSGNNSQFVYDGYGRMVKITETISGSIVSTKQYLWCEDLIAEVRDTGGVLLNQFFAWGEKSGTIPLYFDSDHLGSTRELTNGSGSVQAQYSFDPFGRVEKLQGSATADFQYASYFLHAASGLSITKYRQYSPLIGRWLSRDPVTLDPQYAYVNNTPVGSFDPYGLFKTHGNWCGPNWGSGAVIPEDSPNLPRDSRWGCLISSTGGSARLLLLVA
ncbi:MAG TPA: RHS repeat-associated core domain-containing protein [Oculatellaceae cyanobacterium]